MADGAEPLMAVELTEIQPASTIKTSLFWNFFLPVCTVVGFAIGAVVMLGSAKPLEAFMLAVFVLGIIMRIQGFSLAEITATAMMGIKGIMPAVIILAFAYALNDLSSCTQHRRICGHSHARLVKSGGPACCGFPHLRTDCVHDRNVLGHLCHHNSYRDTARVWLLWRQSYHRLYWRL